MTRAAVVTLVGLATAVVLAALLMLPAVSTDVESALGHPVDRLVNLGRDDAHSGGIGPTAVARGQKRPSTEATVPSGSSALDCPAVVSSDLVTLQKRNVVGVFLDAVERRHGKLQRRLVADLASYRPKSFDIRDSTVGVFAENRPPRSDHLAGGSHSASEARFAREGLAGVLTTADVPALQARRGSSTVLGEFIRQHVGGFQDVLANPVGLTAFGAHELAIAIEEGITVAEFEQLLDESGADINAGSTGGGNLVRTAAINGRPDILRALINRGAVLRNDEVVASRTSSVLDDMAGLLRTLPPPDQASFAAVAAQLVAAGERPFLPSTAAAFERSGPGVQTMTLHPRAAELVTSAAVGADAAGLALLLAEWDERIDDAKQAEDHCARQPLEPNWAEDATRSLAAKLGHEPRVEQPSAAARALLESTTKQIRADPRWPELWAALAEVFRHPDASNWHAAMALTGQWPEVDLHGILLDLALGSGASLEVIRELAERCGGLPTDAIMKLVRRPWPGGAAVAEALLWEFEMDVHVVDDQGRDALRNLAEGFFANAAFQKPNPPALAMAAFLGEYSMAEGTSAAGLDALDYVLHEALAQPNRATAAGRFARVLIDHGASVARSHRELMALIAESSPVAATRIVEAVPELAPQPA